MTADSGTDCAGAGSDERDDPDVLHCLSCLAPTDPLAHWCPRCGVPVGQFATTDPILHIYSQGSAFRNAVGARIGRLGLACMWALFGPTTLALASTAAGVWQDRWLSAGYGQRDPLAFVIVVSIAFALLAVLYATLLYQITRNFIRQRRYDRGLCGHCSYPLTGLPPPRCPECREAVPTDIFDAAIEDRR